jgi:flagellar protein FliJ
MARQFSLAGLLRIRRMQQDEALARAGAAQATLDAHRARVQAARSALATSPDEVTSSFTLLAVAAARSSASSMLTELMALDERCAGDVAEARSELVTARTRVVGLEKLQERHDAAVAAEELATEQAVLDEIGAQSWHRQHTAAHP